MFIMTRATAAHYVPLEGQRSDHEVPPPHGNLAAPRIVPSQAAAHPTAWIDPPPRSAALAEGAPACRQTCSPLNSPPGQFCRKLPRRAAGSRSGQRKGLLPSARAQSALPEVVPAGARFLRWAFRTCGDQRGSRAPPWSTSADLAVEPPLTLSVSLT